MTAHDQPQFQGKLKYVGQLSPDFKLTAWADGIYQLQRAELGDAVVSNFNLAANGTAAVQYLLHPGANVRASGVDGGARVDWGGFSVVGYGYWGDGLGTTGLFFDAFSPNGQQRKSSGYYAEAEYTFGQGFPVGFLSDRFTIGGSYGQSFLSNNSFDWTQAYGPYMLKSNSSAIGFIRYNLTDWVACQFEFINSRSINQAGGSIKSNAISGGTTFFF